MVQNLHLLRMAAYQNQFKKAAFVSLSSKDSHKSQRQGRKHPLSEKQVGLLPETQIPPARYYSLSIGTGSLPGNSLGALEMLEMFLSCQVFLSLLSFRSYSYITLSL